MVEVDYHIGEQGLRTYAEPNFLLVNRASCYFKYGKNPSKYDGFFVKINDQTIKVVDVINTEVEGEVRAVHHKGYKVEVIRDDVAEEFYLPGQFNSMVYRTSKKLSVEILFDMKRQFDHSEWGRHYSTISNDGMHLIGFSNGSLKLYVAVSEQLQPGESWHKRDYIADRARNSPPYTRYVYSPGKYKGSIFVISVAKTEREAVEENNYIINNLTQIERQDSKEFRAEIEDIKAPDRVGVAYNLCRYYLRHLATSDGMVAGLPWFNEVWSRDELISLIGIKNLDYVKARLLHYLGLVHFDGKLPSKLNEPGKCSDASGWLFRRLLDNFNKLSINEQALIEERAQVASHCYTKYYQKDGLVHCEPGETWMDSLEREGARLEIQALRYSVLELIRLLTKQTSYVRIEHQLLTRIKKDFFKEGYLWDAPDDPTIRPNIFIAAYVAPKLLKPEEWKLCFTKCNKALWNNWGGYSSVDKNDKRFRSSHSGENPMSYHNGDSWWFVNNLAGVAMKRLNLMDKHVSKIIEASTEEILEHGCLGCHSEVSSASRLESAGCALQAWSCATYIELVEEICNE